MLSAEDFAMEYGYFEHFAERWTLAPLALTDWDDETDGSPLTRDPIPVNSPSRAALASVLAGYFHQETEYDFRPYEAGDERHAGRDVFLIPSRQIRVMFPVITGAVEVRTLGEVSVVAWAWLHPVERAKTPTAWTDTFEWLSTHYPRLGLEGPLSPPMLAWSRDRNISVYIRE
ncbi:MAG: hypothetical protein K0R99_3776 [Microbacterium sp.]|jgi:hypothetical protein|uniref:hypothetical protein n=1 Tax=Microbacterium sp. TaxID=51671 RepID=UPI0026295FC6|nr:hypothetical protein [Microbacterium sp.]MDF2562330.1 hypothetical protein [Microbacterium sp.]